MCSQTRSSCAKAFDNRSGNKNLKPKKSRGGWSIWPPPPPRLLGLSLIRNNWRRRTIAIFVTNTYSLHFLVSSLYVKASSKWNGLATLCNSFGFTKIVGFAAAKRRETKSKTNEHKEEPNKWKFRESEEGKRDEEKRKKDRERRKWWYSRCVARIFLGGGGGAYWKRKYKLVGGPETCSPGNF